MSNAMKVSRHLLLLLLCIYSLPILIQGSDQHERKPYIVYMGDLQDSRSYAMEDHHNSLLATAIGDEHFARKSKIYSYGKSFNGFVARLLPHEAKKLQEENSVVSVFPNTQRQLHTTRSWDFLGMPLTVKRQPNIESDIIVGLFDSGIWIDSPSFNDKGYGPPPRRWKGKCDQGANFTGCNNKVIGAKYFNLGENDPKDNPSPVDEVGHGTHTASTVAGAAVEGASLFGVGGGTARGGVPSARIAMYKVCWGVGCSDMNILAAFDEAIADGVDIISVSLGGPSMEFFNDSIAIGAFHAMKRGILTSCSAGNSGPAPMTVTNVAPWIMTVAASSIDRQFTTEIVLGDGRKGTGVSINTFSPKMYPLISGALAAKSGNTTLNSSACEYGSLSKDKVKGKIVYCLPSFRIRDYIDELEGAGFIIALETKTDRVDVTNIPGTYVEAYTVGKSIDQYINSTKNAQAVIHKSTQTRIPAPAVASFSSRGPQKINPNILKPDLIAPGLAILAAFSKLPTLTSKPHDTRHSAYNILSGTSMACPHATAAAAYVKSYHPDWSPAEIKSALMTTATPMRIPDQLAELASGSGQINPVKAVNPGLVYDIRMESYIAFLCNQGYNNTAIGLLVGSRRFNCSSFKPPPGTDGVNYPTMHIYLNAENSSISAVFHRTVKNVGNETSRYSARITTPKGLSVEVVPTELQFSRLHQEQSFKVVLKGPPMPKGIKILSALLEWNDNEHTVRTPIVVSSDVRSAASLR